MSKHATITVVIHAIAITGIIVAVTTATATQVIEDTIITTTVTIVTPIITTTEAIPTIEDMEESIFNLE